MIINNSIKFRKKQTSKESLYVTTQSVEIRIDLGKYEYFVIQISEFSFRDFVINSLSHNLSLYIQQPLKNSLEFHDKNMGASIVAIFFLVVAVVHVYASERPDDIYRKSLRLHQMQGIKAAFPKRDYSSMEMRSSLQGAAPPPPSVSHVLVVICNNAASFWGYFAGY